MNAVKCVSDRMIILKLFVGSMLFNGQDCRNVLLNGGRGKFYENFFPYDWNLVCNSNSQEANVRTSNKKLCNNTE